MYFKLKDYEVEDTPWENNFESTFIESMTYDPYRYTVVVKYVNGEQWMYTGVPESVWLRFQMTESKGKFLWQHIKGHYPGTKIQDTAQ